MKWFKETDSGIILPPDPPLPPQHSDPEMMGMYIMDHLGADQICPFIQMVHDAGGRIHCVYNQGSLGLMGRYAVIYRCDKELGMEVRT